MLGSWNVLHYHLWFWQSDPKVSQTRREVEVEQTSVCLVLPERPSSDFTSRAGAPHNEGLGLHDTRRSAFYGV